jgi:hypothetical protein
MGDAARFSISMLAGGLIAMLAGRFTGKSMLFGCKAL